MLHLKKCIKNASHAVPEESVSAQKLQGVAASAAGIVRHTTVLSVQNHLGTVWTHK